LANPGEAHLLPKRQFLEGITGAYGWAINGGRAVGRLVDPTALTLPPGLGLSEASAAILGRDQRTRYDDVLVRTDPGVFGEVSVSDLLDRLAHLHADEARTALRMAEAERRTASRLRSALEREHAANEHLRVLDELKPPSCRRSRTTRARRWPRCSASRSPWSAISARCRKSRSPSCKAATPGSASGPAAAPPSG
jgi:hypothetical protein